MTVRGFILGIAIASVFGGAASFARAEEKCLGFKDLPETVAKEFVRDPKKIRLEFTPVELGAKPAYVIADLDSCNVFNGNCDSQIYLAIEKNCYDAVLSFRGKWQGMQNSARELASAELWVESNSQTRAFKFDAKKKVFVEKDRP